MNAVREFPPNPHALVIHTDDRITDQVVEAYWPGTGSPEPAWIRAVLALPGVRALSLNAYKIRLQKHKDASWKDLLGPFEEVLRESLGVAHLMDLVEGESPRRAFAWHGEPLSRRVFEGKTQAAADPVASRLFDLHGVAEVILDGNRVEVRKCPLRSWRDLSPRIEAALQPD